MCMRPLPCVVVARPATPFRSARGKAAVVFTVAALLSAAASVASAQVTILPASGPEPSQSARAPHAINDSGTVVGYTDQVVPPTVDASAPVQWSGPGFVASILPRPVGAPSGGNQLSGAFGINNNGVVVGQVAWPFAGPGGNFAAHAVRWDGGVPTDLGSVPGGNFAAARAINNAGEIAGFGSGATTLAVRWTPAGVLQPLDRLPTHNESLAFDINASGRIVGYSGFLDGDFSTERRPTAWDGTTAADLTSPAGYNHGEARSINDSGSIVGSSGFFDPDLFDYTDFRATQWIAGVPTLLPLLDGFSASAASSINASGMAVGACYPNGSSAFYGFDGVPVLWSNGAATDLRPLLSPYFAPGATFSVNDINALGQITGVALTDNGLQGFVLTVPAPSAAGLLGLGGLMAARRRRGVATFVALAAVASGASVASAQWTVTNLHPASSTGSRARAVDGGQQVGTSEVGGIGRAGIWSGTAGSWVSLNPAGIAASGAAAIGSGQQVGFTSAGFQSHAALWSGTAASWVDLNPTNADYSEARAVGGGQQAGFIRQPGNTAFLASLWSGTAASWINLNPSGARESRATALSGGQQSGYAEFDGRFHAGLWSGTAASWVDLNPDGALQSQANATSGVQQVGSVFLSSDITTHASLWTGTATSWVDLHPVGAEDSTALAISGLWQAGSATFSGIQHAGIWGGSAASWVDLHTFLPAAFTSSSCSGAFSDGTNLFITGAGTNMLTGQSEALLWTRIIPAPGAAGLFGMAGLMAARRRRRVATFVALAAVASGASVASAQWTVTNLHPAGATESSALAADGGQQAGYATVGGVFRASLWSGTAASWVDLNPAGSTYSEALASTGGQQAGYAEVGGAYRASAWSGTAASWVDLNPAGSSESIAWAISGEQQAGYSLVGGFQRASLWTGTAASWVDLHPAGSTGSIAYAISGGQQAGYAFVGGVFRASLWSGTAASWVDLSPAGSTFSSANAISGGQQAGYATVGGVGRASLWSGTADSWVDLSPAGSTDSLVHAISGGQQAGYARLGGVDRASLWSGTAASWVDLSAFLPAGFSESFARGISSDGVNTYIAGYGFNTLTSRTEALLWTRPVPAPGAAALLGLGGLMAARRRRHV